MHFHKLLDRRNPGSCPCLIPIFGFFKLCKRLKDLPGFLFDIPIPVSLTVISASMSVNLALISFRRLACQLRTSVKNSLNDSGHEKSHRIKKIIKELVDGCFYSFPKDFFAITFHPLKFLPSNSSLTASRKEGISSCCGHFSTHCPHCTHCEAYP